MAWDWYYTVAGIIGAEILYLMARYEYSGPEFRQRAWEYAWSYALAWLAIVGVAAVYMDRDAITSAILSGFGLPSPQALSSGYLSFLMGQEASSWGLYWLLLIILRTIGSSSIPIASGFAAGLGDFLGKWVSLQLTAFQWFVFDLAILAILTMYWEYFSKYGLFAVTTSLIIPRSTRGIGASLTAYYLVLAVMLPVMYGIILREMPYTQAVPIYMPCNPLLLEGGLLSPSLLSCVWQDVTAWASANLINGILTSPMSAYTAFIWDAALDLTYIISFTIAYWLARLIDAGAFRLLETLT